MPQDPSTKRERGWTNWFGEGGVERKELDGHHGDRPVEALMGGRRGSEGLAGEGQRMSGFGAGGSGGGGQGTYTGSASTSSPASPSTTTFPPFSASPFYPLATDYLLTPRHQQSSALSASEAAAQQARDRMRLAASSGQQFVPSGGGQFTFAPPFSPSASAFPTFSPSQGHNGDILPAGYPPCFASATFFDEAEQHLRRISNGSAPFSPELPPFTFGSNSGEGGTTGPLSSFFSLPTNQKKAATLSRPSTNAASSRNGVEGGGVGGSHSPTLSSRPDKLSKEEKERIKLSLSSASATGGKGAKSGVRSKAVPIKPPPARSATAPPAQGQVQGLNASSAPFVPTLPSANSASTSQPMKNTPSPSLKGTITFSPSSAAFTPQKPPPDPPLRRQASSESLSSASSSISDGSVEDAFATPPGSPSLKAQDDTEGEKGEVGKQKAKEEDEGRESDWEDEESSGDEIVDGKAVEGGKAEVGKATSGPGANPSSELPSHPDLVYSSPESAFTSATSATGRDSLLLTPPQTPHEGSPHERNEPLKGSDVEVEIEPDEGNTARPASPSFPSASPLDGGGLLQSAGTGGADKGGEEDEPPAKKARVEKAEVGAGGKGGQDLPTPSFTTFLDSSFANTASAPGSQRSSSPARLSTASSILSTIGTAYARPVYGPTPPFSNGATTLSPVASAFSPTSVPSFPTPQQPFPMFSHPSSSAPLSLTAAPFPSPQPGPSHAHAHALTLPDPLSALLEVTRENGVWRHKVMKLQSRHVADKEEIERQKEELGRMGVEVEELWRKFGESEAKRAELAQAATNGASKRGGNEHGAELGKLRAELGTARTETAKLQQELRTLRFQHAEETKAASERALVAQMSATERTREEKVRLEKEWEAKLSSAVAAAACEAKEAQITFDARLVEEVKAAEERVRAQKGEEQEAAWVERVKKLKEEVEGLKEKGREEAERIRAEGEKKIKDLKAEKDLALTAVRRSLDQAKADVDFLTKSKVAMREEKKEAEKRLADVEAKAVEAVKAVEVAKKAREKAEGELGRERKERLEEKRAFDSEHSLRVEAVREIVTLEDNLKTALSRVTTLEDALETSLSATDEVMNAYRDSKEAFKGELEVERERREEKEKQYAEFREKAKEVVMRKEKDVNALKTQLAAALESASSTQSKQNELDSLNLKLKVIESGSEALRKELDAAKAARRAAELALEEKEKKLVEKSTAKDGVEGLFRNKQGDWEKKIGVEKEEVVRLKAELSHLTAKLDRLSSESQEHLDGLMQENQKLEGEREEWKRRAGEAERERDERVARTRPTGTAAFLANIRSPPSSVAGGSASGTRSLFGGQ